MTALEMRVGPALAIMALMACGCGRQAPAPGASPAPPTAPGDGAVAELPAESSLSIKRGNIVLAADARTLRLCGEPEDLWLLDQEDQSLDETYARLTGESAATLYVEVRGERTPTPAGTGIPAEYGEAFVLEEVLYAGLPGQGKGCEAAAPDYRALARGNEPFWSVQVSAEKMIFKGPDLPAPIEFAVVDTLDVEGTVTYRAASDGRTLELTVTDTACSDSMSGEYFAYTALARLDSRELRGCARPGE